MKKTNKIMLAISMLSIILMIGIISVSIYNVYNAKDLPFLNQPVNLSVNEGNILSWDAVENAKGYLILIDNNAPIEISESLYDLTDYLLHSGEKTVFIISVLAVGDEINYYNSEWSEQLSYNR